MRCGLVRLLASAALLAGCRTGSGATRAPDAGDASTAAAGRADRAGACQWAGQATILHQAGDTLYQVWSLAEASMRAEWRPADLRALTAFQHDVVARLEAADAPTDPAGLLQRQVGYYAARADSDSRRESENGRLVLDGAAGTVRPLACLEALLLDFQARRFPMVRQPTEFHAFVLRRDPRPGDADGVSAGGVADAPLLIYFAASSAPWPPRVGRLVSLLEAKRREGWRVVAHLHNHPFYLDRLGTLATGQPSADIAGAVAPSITDVHFYRGMHAELRLETALVTNGFTTLEIPAAAFDRLHARGEPSPP